MYAFVQALIREVAYGTLALRDRRAHHLAAARFFESLGDDELAGALAAHYMAACQAAPEGPEGEAIATGDDWRSWPPPIAPRTSGRPGQAIGFLEQALQVTTDAAERRRSPGARRLGSDEMPHRTDLAEAFLRAGSIELRRTARRPRGLVADHRGPRARPSRPRGGARMPPRCWAGRR